MSSGGDVEQATVYVDGVALSTDEERRVVPALVALGVAVISEETGASVREGIAVDVIWTEIIVASELVVIKSL